RPAGGDDDAPAPGQAQVKAQTQDTGLDGLLDEIDAVLETNAEEFVKGFVQKGGQ
ncbi:ubiquitin-like protein Pup, partial [Micrococcus flavus]